MDDATTAQEMTPEQLKTGLNSWPTFASQLIAVEDVAQDWSTASIRLDLKPENGNYFGTQFGGSMFSMIDPFLVILLAKQLGPGYQVWDKSVEIDFVRPGLGPVTAHVEMPPTTVAEVREATAEGEKDLRWFTVEIKGEDGAVVAVQRREIYTRKNRR